MPLNPLALSALAKTATFDSVADHVALPPEFQAAAARLEAGLRVKMYRVYKGLVPADAAERELADLFREIRSKAGAGDASYATMERGLTSSMAAVGSALATDPVYAPFKTSGVMKPGAVDRVSLVSGLTAEAAKAGVAGLHRVSLEGLAGALKGVTPQTAWRTLRFSVDKIHCLKVNDSFFNGNSDEIMLAINSVNAAGGTGYSYTSAGLSDFDPGETKVPLAAYSTVNFGVGQGFPETFACLVSLIEKDNGGAADMVKRIYGALREKIKQGAEAIGEAVGELIGAPELGPIIAAVVQWVVERLVGWLVDWLSDDYLGSFVATARLGSASGVWTTTGTPTVSHTRTIAGDGAKYEVTYTWKLLP